MASVISSLSHCSLPTGQNITGAESLLPTNLRLSRLKHYLIVWRQGAFHILILSPLPLDMNIMMMCGPLCHAPNSLIPTHRIFTNESSHQQLINPLEFSQPYPTSSKFFEAWTSLHSLKEILWDQKQLVDTQYWWIAFECSCGRAGFLTRPSHSSQAPTPVLDLLQSPGAPAILLHHSCIAWHMEMDFKETSSHRSWPLHTNNINGGEQNTSSPSPPQLRPVNITRSSQSSVNIAMVTSGDYDVCDDNIDNDDPSQMLFLFLTSTPSIKLMCTTEDTRMLFLQVKKHFF